MTVSFSDKLLATIADTTDISNAIVRAQIHDATSISILSPNGLPVDTFVIQVTADPAGLVGWCTLKDRDGNNAFVPAANEACWYPELPSFGAFRIKDVTGVVTGDQVFSIVKLHTI